MKIKLIFITCIFVMLYCEDHHADDGEVLEKSKPCTDFTNTLNEDTKLSLANITLIKKGFECGSIYCETQNEKGLNHLAFINPLEKDSEVTYVLTKKGLTCSKLNWINSNVKLESIKLEHTEDGETTEELYSLFPDGKFAFFVNYDPDTFELNSSPNFIGSGRYKYLSKDELELCNFHTSKNYWKKNSEGHRLLSGKCSIIKIPIKHMERKKIVNENFLIITEYNRKILKKSSTDGYGPSTEVFYRIIYSPEPRQNYNSEQNVR